MGTIHHSPETTARHREVGRSVIAAEIAALERLRDSLDADFEAAAQALVDIQGKLMTLGVGKSGHAAQKIAATMRSVGVPALHLSVSDALHGDLGVVTQGDVALLLSKSGTTREVLTLIPHLRSLGVTLIAIVGSPRSPLAQQSDFVIDASVLEEGCPLQAAPMASVLAAQAVGDALAAAVIQARGFTHQDFARLHPAGALGARLSLTVGDVMRQGRELPRVSDRATLKDAVIEITRTGYGAVCVLAENDRLAGFITDGDIRRVLVDTDDLGSVALADVMTPAPLSVAPEVPLSQALLMLEQRRKPFLTAPVTVDGERCVGLLRLHDTVQAHLKS